MLYEAMFWRARADRPSFDEAFTYPDIQKALAGWGDRDGDTAVVALVESIPVGAAWYRFWNDDNFDRGYVDKHTPVLAIGIHRDYRHQGIGTQMIGWLIDYAAKQSIQRISLSVSKDNYAINLYRQQGFLEYVDTGDAFIMVRKV